MPDHGLDLLTGALLIARDVYPTLDTGEQAQRIDDLADQIGSLRGCTLEEQTGVLATHLYERMGFRGNSDDYYDPRNWFVNDVLERRLGIPISLALIYTEICDRVGVVARGVNFPGHFLVRIEDPAGGEPRIVDPFTNGRVMSRAGLLRLLRHAIPASSRVESSLLEPASIRAILVRFLNNLRAIYAERQDLPHLVMVLSRLLELRPGTASYLRDRGLAAARLGASRAAVTDFERYLEQAPDAAEAPEIRQLIVKLSERQEPYN